MGKIPNSAVRIGPGLEVVKYTECGAVCAGMVSSWMEESKPRTARREGTMIHTSLRAEEETTKRRHGVWIWVVPGEKRRLECQRCPFRRAASPWTNREGAWLELLPRQVRRCSVWRFPCATPHAWGLLPQPPVSTAATSNPREHSRYHHIITVAS